MRVKIIGGFELGELEEKINEFVKGKRIVKTEVVVDPATEPGYAGMVIVFIWYKEERA